MGCKAMLLGLISVKNIMNEYTYLSLTLFAFYIYKALYYDKKNKVCTVNSMLS